MKKFIPLTILSLFGAGVLMLTDCSPVQAQHTTSQSLDLKNVKTPHASLTEITYNCSFYDQSHFARTFKLFTGLTPKQYKQSSGELPGHILEFAEGNN